jgi:cobalt-zinc-cadmium efflux system membrane fusion protein
MTRRLLAIAVAAAVLTVPGCRREAPRDERAATEARDEAAAPHAEEANAIHLSDDMRRDLRVSTASVVERPGAEDVSVLGEIAADQARYAEVAPPTGGQVVRVLVDVNTVVGKDAPLAQLRSTELGRARADLIGAEARRDFARQTLERKRALAAERIVAAREAQEAEAALRAAEAEVAAATAGLRALGIAATDSETDSSLFFVRSPIDGRVLDRQVTLGQFAGTDARLFTVADLSRVWLIAQVFEREAVNLQVGGIAHITMAALPGREFDGRVTQVGRQVDPGSRTVPVRVELANPGGVLRPGMSANVRLEISGRTRTILAVPAAALQRVGAEWLAFVPRPGREFEMRVVGRGRDLGMEVEVLSGLKAGETVVVEGAFLLKAEAEKRRGGGDEHGH